MNDLDGIRQQGHNDAAQTVDTHAPEDPIQRVAWAVGYGTVDAAQTAVDRARQAGATWRQIGQAAGINWRTAQSRWGSGPDRQRRYMARKKSEG